MSIATKKRMRHGEPNLSDQERNMSDGVMVLFYTDGDYRPKFFDSGLIIRYIADTYDSNVIENPIEEAMMVLEEKAERIILDELVPFFRQALVNMRDEEGEPEQEGFEVYWRGALIYQDFNEGYTPLPRIDA